MTGHLGQDHEDLIRLLVKHEVEFVVVGGWAVITHGYDRLTDDLDLFYRKTLANAEKAYRALTEFFGAPPPGLAGPEDMLTADNIQYGYPPNRADLMNTIDGATFEEAWNGRIPFPFFPGCCVISLPALIANKKTVARDEDCRDVRRLEKIFARRDGR